ncbi:LOW QUALITY PROTEIN: ankyrin repeat domain-containing protein 61-like, partial [Anableps anableps]
FAILPLHLAASYRRAQSLQSLLLAGADAEVKSIQTSQTRVYTFKHVSMDEQSQQTALHVSVRYRALSAVQMLISYGADVNAVDSSGMTPLKDITASLISQGADVNMRMQHSRNTPLHLAAVMTETTKILEEDISCISELLEHGVKPNTINKAGMSPLHQVSLGDEELGDLLLRYGASVNKLSIVGENCLFLFLNHRPNMRNRSLLMKLLSLSSPLSLNQNGCLPSTMTQPCFFKEREQLFKLTQQPKRLQEICKHNIYLKHIRGRKAELRKALPCTTLSLTSVSGPASFGLLLLLFFLVFNSYFHSS